MELALEQFERTKDCLPRQRGNVRVGNLVLLNALLYVLENGGKWRRLPGSTVPGTRSTCGCIAGARQACSDTSKSALSNIQLPIFTLPRWRGRQSLMRSYCSRLSSIVAACQEPLNRQ